MSTTRFLVLVGAVVLAAGLHGEESLDAARARAAELRRQIAHHDELYFREAAPEVTDAQYDALKRELRDLAQRYPQVDAATGVGDDRVEGFPVRLHRAPMLSLEKTHTESELAACLARWNQQLGRTGVTVVVEPKYDGFAISVTYEHGRLVRAVTRGDGLQGADVTAALLRLVDLPAQLARRGRPVPDIIELRGEIYMSPAEFKRINEEREAAGEEPYAHPRNLAVGTLRQQDDGKTPRRLEVVFYGVGAVLPKPAAPRSQQELHACIRAWGLPGVKHFTVAGSMPEAWAWIQALGRRQSALAYPIDGAVVKVDDVRWQAALGVGPEAPRWAVAYKFPAETVATRLLGITLQVGRTGAISPVAELAPVKLGGSTVSRAALHNRAEIARKDLRVGDWVVLEKAGDIIPVVTGPDLSRRPTEAVPYVFPEDCPACSATFITQGKTTRCQNDDCPARIQRRLEHFVSQAAVGIRGLGRSTLAALVSEGLVREPADLYKLDVATLNRVTTGKTSKKLVDAIQASRRGEPWRFMYGVGVPGVGPAAARALARIFPSLTVWARAQEKDYRGTAISGAARQACLDYFAENRNRQAAEALDSAIRGK
jgi:DNA ligase (NAD+)